MRVKYIQNTCAHPTKEGGKTTKTTTKKQQQQQKQTNHGEC